MNRLKEIRLKNGFTQYELGRLIGKYQTRIWHIENGYYPAKQWEKEALAKVLDVAVNDIFPDTLK
jgi:DNA-binding XRE family transcriptional regulator